MRADYLEINSSVSNHRLKIKKVVADITLTAEDSGSIVLVNPTAATTVTLPTLANAGSGWYCKIIATEDAAATDGSMDAIINVDMGSGTNLANIGQVHEVDGTAGDFAVANDDFFVITAAGSPGDYADFWTDGTRWYFQGFVKDLSDSSVSANATTIA
tara:strand:- start:65 stop:538 length:474 start_codon:yes stop_codon:yes gene_type:complete